MLMATVIKRSDGWFRLIPPDAEHLPPNVDYYFREFEALKGFADACGWMLRWKGGGKRGH